MKKINKTLSLLILIWISILLIDKILCVVGEEEPLQKLSITPYLKSGQVAEAREATRVKNLGGFDVLSYSGYITIEEECNTNLFFWFFPAADDSENAPLILWHGGGPGGSALFGLFVENGPFSVDKEGQVHLRSGSWTLNRSVIYLDSPVGAGFSDADKEECFLKSAYETAQHVHAAMSQFFQLFPEQSLNDLYIFSGSYGGKFAPEIAHEIHVQNLKAVATDGRVMKLKGISINSGFSDPFNQIDYGEFYYSIGIIDKHERDYFQEKQALAKDCITKGRWGDAFDIIEPLVIGLNNVDSHLKNITGIQFPYNFLKTHEGAPGFMKYHIEFLNRPETRKQLHIDLSKNFTNSNPNVYHRFKEDIYQSVKLTVEELLNAGYHIIIGSSQLDLIVPHQTIRKFVNGLNWRYSKEFTETKTNKWISDKGLVGGYLKSVENLSYIMIRSAGHLWIHDQPEWSYEIMMRFTETK